jgi:hypothetical protein
MRATLYQALGIPKESSDDEVRAALRGQIRKYYAKTRDGQGNVEEALRFINHASRILSDPELRAQYDHDLAASEGTVNDRIAHVVSTAIDRASIDRPPAAVARRATSATEVRGRRGKGPDPAPDKGPHHPGLTEQVTSVRQSTVITASLCVLFGTFIAVAIALVTPADAVQAAKQVLFWLTLLLLALTVVYGVVHGIAWTQRRVHLAAPELVPPTELAILNWRRQKSVFLGTNQPQEDASWVFQLRMAELERAKVCRTSEPRPWNRLSARLFDYALWGLILAVPLSELRSIGVVSSETAYWLSHPLFAPMLMTASWVPVEAMLIAWMHTTPGKWLFGVYLQFSISDAYASRDAFTQFRRALARSVRVWWEGVGCGFPLLAPVMIAIAHEKVAEYQETPWDFAEDCLVTHGPVGGLNAVTGVAGLAAMLWLYGVAWYQPMGESFAWARTTAVAALPSPSTLASAEFWRRGATPAAVAPADGADASSPPARASGAAATPAREALAAREDDAPIDPELAALFTARNKRVAAVKAEGPRLLEARNYRQAADLCRLWANLELGNADAWRCLGRALEGLGRHQEAVNAFRKAKQYDPTDGTLDAAISRSQNGIVADFLSRRGG